MHTAPRYLALPTAALVLAACAGPLRRVAALTAAEDLDCGAGPLRIEQVHLGSYRAAGCGRTGRYRCHFAGLKVCCYAVASEGELAAWVVPHRFGGHHTGAGQRCAALDD